MNYRIVVDSTVYLSEEEFKSYGIKRASLNIIDKDESFKELSVDKKFVFERLDNGHHLTTSQPSPGEFFDIYEELLSEGVEKIFVVTLAEPLSGTYQSATLARTMLDNPNKVHIFKSQMAAFGNEMLVLEIQRLINEGKEEKEIIEFITKLNSKSNLIFTLENLHYIARSGRLSRAKALIGTVLRVKPLIRMIDGKLDLFKSERTHKKVITNIINNMKETTKGAKTIYVRILSHNSIEQAKALEAKINETFNNIKLSFNEYLGPIFSLHLGSVGYGISWCVE
ncbi:DegV domain-containing protein [Candidatus Izimaplasma bacterium HR1]|jgi:DegV family protein with EDD domain|uniref:DegV family protein n=1 Tax=Candidatus Izimoplasma sp. HR1 TaxID=1541959 RepID=UPI0004F87170|nr:DegV domain-containing protein [Candidatus Izimaplasma bacterium HR1]